MAEAKEFPWRVAIIDIECVPSDDAPILKSGKLITSNLNRHVIQICAMGFDGKVIAEANINPEVNWERIAGFHKYTGRCWRCSPKNVASESKKHKTFRLAMPEFNDKIHKALGAKVIFVGHNTNRWDAVIVSRQMAENKLSFPFEVRSFDSRYLLGKWRRDKNDRKWSLEAIWARVFGGAPMHDVHTARGDCQMLQNLLKHFTNETTGGYETESLLLGIMHAQAKKAFDDRVYKPEKAKQEEKKEQPLVAKKQKFDQAFQKLVTIVAKSPSIVDEDPELERVRDDLLKLCLGDN